MSYQGWTNYETWAVHLWLANDEGSNSHWEGEAEARWADADKEDGDARHSALCDLAGLLKEEHEQSMPEVEGIWGDLLGSALQEVDWMEIAEAFLDAAIEAAA